MTRIIGVAGGSCSGKTTLVRRVAEFCADSSILAQDHYYLDQSEKFDKDGGRVNFDHPSAIDFDLLAEHLIALKQGRGVEVPIYDFKTHQRLSHTTYLRPCQRVLVDGTLILSQPQIRSLLDRSIFIDCAFDLRFQRRLNRDVNERGRTPEGVKIQFEKQVEPMHQKFVEPSKEHAMCVIPQELLLEDFEACVKLTIEAH